MNKKLLLFTVILSNIAFATVTYIEVQKSISSNCAQKNITTLTENATKYLIDKGLDSDIAHQKIEKSLAGYEDKNHEIMQQIVATFHSIKEQNIARYIGNRALENKQVDLNEYDTLVGFIQENTNRGVEPKMYEKIAEILKHSTKVHYS